MTNREAHEEAAGYNLCPEFFTVSGIDPDAEYEEAQQEAKVDLQTATNSPKLPELKFYLEYMDQCSMLQTGHRLTQSELDLLEAGYKFIARQLRAGA